MVSVHASLRIVIATCLLLNSDGSKHIGRSTIGHSGSLHIQQHANFSDGAVREERKVKEEHAQASAPILVMRNGRFLPNNDRLTFSLQKTSYNAHGGWKLSLVADSAVIDTVDHVVDVIETHVIDINDRVSKRVVSEPVAITIEPVQDDLLGVTDESEREENTGEMRSGFRVGEIQIAESAGRKGYGPKLFASAFFRRQDIAQIQDGREINLGDHHVGGSSIEDHTDTIATLFSPEVDRAVREKGMKEGRYNAHVRDKVKHPFYLVTVQQQLVTVSDDPKNGCFDYQISNSLKTGKFNRYIQMLFGKVNFDRNPWCVNMCRSLQSMWFESKVAHNDLKGENIMFTHDKQAYLIDFALVKGGYKDGREAALGEGSLEVIQKQRAKYAKAAVEEGYDKGLVDAQKSYAEQLFEACVDRFPLEFGGKS